MNIIKYKAIKHRKIQAVIDQLTLKIYQTKKFIAFLYRNYTRAIQNETIFYQS